MSDVLKKPVHHILVKSTLLQDLEATGKLTGAKQPRRLPVVREEKVTHGMPRAHVSPQKQANIQARLQMAYAHIPPLPPEKVPPCQSCVTKACCTAYVVTISEDEYASGLLGEYAIKITPEVKVQITGRLLKAMTLTSLVDPSLVTPSFVLEGTLGQPCPFLRDNGDCGIYDTRPFVCRTYSCLDDPRITPGVRDGTETIKLIKD